MRAETRDGCGGEIFRRLGAGGLRSLWMVVGFWYMPSFLRCSWLRWIFCFRWASSECEESILKRDSGLLVRISGAA